MEKENCTYFYKNIYKYGSIVINCVSFYLNLFRLILFYDVIENRHERRETHLFLPLNNESKYFSFFF